MHVDHSRHAQSPGSSLPGTRVAAHGKRAAPLLARFLLTAQEAGVGVGGPAYSLNPGSGTGRRSVIVFSKDEICSADLVDMQAFSSFNKGFKYILTVIDVVSKYAWTVPIKDKSAASVTKTFEKIISDRIPKKLWVDEGKEFYNATFKKLLDKHKTDIYSTFNEGNAVVIERFNRTLKNIMWKYFTANNTRFYLDALDQMVKHYNEKVHSTIKMTPKEASKDINRGKVYFSIIRKQNKSRTSIKYEKKVIKSVSANIKDILKRDIPLTGQKKSSLLIK